MENAKYGIVYVKMHKDLSFQKEVMQFGYVDRKKASQVLDKSLKSLDRMTEMLYVFEYPADRQEELEIGEPLPAFAVSDFDRRRK